MTITSFWFFVLLAVGAIIYYLTPGKLQWITLLALSIIFYCFAATPFTIVYVAISTFVAWGSTLFVQKLRKESARQNISFVIIACAIIINIAMWFVMKAMGLWRPIADVLLHFHYNEAVYNITHKEIIAALGMGYYTLQIIGYIIDCYWETIEPQKNPLKLFLFAIYFPQMTTGPISRYSQLENLYEKHSLNYRNISFGAQRVLWGLTKKLVLAERLARITSGINSDPERFFGFYSWILLLIYPLQMYADFSGCTDIVLGGSEIFGIRLPENFNNPFFSRSSQEFWQRWHITLGAWAKDYVLYPLLKSDPIIKLGRFTKKKWGRNQSKFITNLVGMFVLWMVMGIWHGSWKYVVGVSLWYWLILMLGELCSSLLKKVTTTLQMKTESFSWHLFQSMRTYVIYAVGAAFFSLGVNGALSRIYDALKVIIVKGYANPWILFSVEEGKTWQIRGEDYNIIIICLAVMLIVAVLREKFGYARIWMEKQSFVFRWFVWISLFVFVLIYGMYGPDFDASVFIYQGF